MCKTLALCKQLFNGTASFETLPVVDQNDRDHEAQIVGSALAAIKSDRILTIDYHKPHNGFFALFGAHEAKS